MSKQLRANLLLVLTAFIWGVAFVAQDVAADTVAPMYFNGLRMMLAALALLPTVAVADRRLRAGHGEGMVWRRMSREQKKELFTGGLCCGCMLALGSVFQQMGIALGAGAGKAGFVTALYIVLVPLAGIFQRKRMNRLVWAAVALSVAGLYFLCMQGGFSIAPADGMLLLSALAYTGHILAVDHFSHRTDCVKMSCIQFFVTALICLMGGLLFETLSWSAVRVCLIPILYAGVISGAMGYTLQIIAQRDAEPAVASLLMSLESVFAVLAGWVLLGDALSLRESFGCLLMMGSIVLAQLPQKAQ